MTGEQTEADKPVCYMVAGPNGAGKTTFAMIYLPQWGDCREFLNADLIAAGLSPLAPETQNITAGKLLLKRIADLTGKKQTFGFETTLSGKSWVKTIGRLQANGFTVVLHFLWLPSAALAKNRVRNRVRQGGHHIPEDTITRRYAAGLRNFLSLYNDRVDHWLLYNAAPEEPELIAESSDGQLQIYNELAYADIIESAKGR